MLRWRYFEHEILKRLQNANPAHPGYQYVSLLVDTFKHHGRHVCLVFEIMGENLATFGTSWNPKSLNAALCKTNSAGFGLRPSVQCHS